MQLKNKRNLNAYNKNMWGKVKYYYAIVFGVAYMHRKDVHYFI